MAKFVCVRDCQVRNPKTRAAVIYKRGTVFHGDEAPNRHFVPADQVNVKAEFVTDPLDELTRKEIMERLDAIKVQYNVKANKEQLVALLRATQI